MKSLKTLLGVAAALAVSAAAQADLVYTFSTGLDGFVNANWSSTGPAGWPGGAALQASSPAGGWTMGGTGPWKEFVWATGEQTAMQALANGTSRLSFDVIVDGTSFNPGVANWYQVWMAGNSDGSAGWTQTRLVDSWHNAGDATLFATHVDLSFADAGWQPGDTWFQLWLGANSDASFPVHFYIDNLNIYAVPEPSGGLLLLSGLGLMALARKRRA